MIVSSVLDADEHAQADGRTWVRETHTDHLGLEYVYSYLAAAGTDTNAVMAARVATIDGYLTRNEIRTNIESVSRYGSLVPSVTLDYSTATQNASALREAYKTMVQAEAVMVGDYLNTLTNAQIANAFGITTGQAATLRTNKLAPAAALAASLRAETGVA